MDGGHKAVGPVVGVAALLIGGVAGLTWGLGGSDADALSMGPESQEQPAAATPVRIRGLELGGRFASDVGGNPVLASTLQKPLKVSIQGHLKALAYSLTNEPFDRLGWESLVKVMANDLGVSAESELRKVALNWNSSRPERVAATELLRVLLEQFGGLESSLPGAFMADLRALSLEVENVALATAAGRSLGAFGSPQDLAELTRRMASDPDPTQRSIAAWAMGAGPQHEVLDCVADQLLAQPTAEALDRTLCILSAWKEQTAGFDLRSVDIVSQAALGAALDRELPDGTRVRALVVMGILDPRASWQPSVDLLSGQAECSALQRRAAVAVVNMSSEFGLGGLLDRSDLAAGVEMALAEAIMESASSLDPTLQDWARHSLEAAASSTEDVLEQWRAMRALRRGAAVGAR